MKYDIYKGTKKDLENGDGYLMYSSRSKSQVVEFCEKNNINDTDLLDSDYINGYWLEEAM